MALPLTVRVKLSSEAAEAISLTPVVVQEFAIRDLLEHVLGVTGKDEARIADLLLRGTIVSGASRFRWQGWQADPESVRELLATFPDPDPSRPFDPANCIRAVLRGGRQPIELPREALARKGLFERDSFWDALMRAAATLALSYAGYSYRDRCDRFARELTFAEARAISDAAVKLKFTTLRNQIHTAGFTHLELHATR